MQSFKLSTLLYRNKRIAFQIYSYGEPWAALTTNIIEVEICIPAWNLPPDVIKSFLDSGQFEDTGKVAATGYVEAPVWRVVCPKLLGVVEKLRNPGSRVSDD